MDSHVLDADITLEHATPVEKNIQQNLNEYYQNQDAIERRLVELDDEWDMERALFMVASTLTIPALALSTRQSKKWLILPAFISGAMLSHAITGWCPPAALLKLLGFRNRAEIDKEKFALKALRGDFKEMIEVPNAVWSAVNK